MDNVDMIILAYEKGLVKGNETRAAAVTVAYNSGLADGHARADANGAWLRGYNQGREGAWLRGYNQGREDAANPIPQVSREVTVTDKINAIKALRVDHHFDLRGAKNIVEAVFAAAGIKVVSAAL